MISSVVTFGVSLREGMAARRNFENSLKPSRLRMKETAVIGTDHERPCVFSRDPFARSSAVSRLEKAHFRQPTHELYFHGFEVASVDLRQLCPPGTL
tara:strand:- start:2390 stop:2680 length:291 start_codon:yes stop_codon:yes gene_type:complete